jgi:O-antigen/teichoic acid export membrane protein
MSLKKNLVYNILLNIANVLYPFITVPYVARVLGAEGVGITSFVTTFAGYFAILAALGIPTYGVRGISKVRDNPEKTGTLFSELFSINILSSLLFSFLYIISIFFIPKLFELKVLLLVAGIQLFLSPFNIDWFFSGRENFKIITIRSLIIKILSLGALFVFVKTKDDLIAYLLLNVFALLGNQFWNFFALHRSEIKFRITLNGLMQHLKPLLYLYASAIAISIYTILDTIMLGFMSNYTQVGYYTSATKVSKLLLFLVTGLGPVILPRMAYYKETDQKDYIKGVLAKSYAFVLFLSLPITTALILIAPDFVPFFFGKDFHGAILPLQILSFLLISIGLNNLSGVQILVGMGFDKPFMKSVLIGTLINIILNIILIPKFGAVGSSIASVFAETLIAFVSAYYVSKHAGILFFSISAFTKNLLAALSLVPVYFFLHHLNMPVWILMFVFFITGTALYFFLQCFFVKNIIILETLSVIKKYFHPIKK